MSDVDLENLDKVTVEMDVRTEIIEMIESALEGHPMGFTDFFESAVISKIREIESEKEAGI